MLTRSLIAISIFVLACASASAQEGAQQFEGFNLQGYTEGGEKAWDVTGQNANVVGETIVLTDVDANRYGKESVNLKAKTGVVDKASGNIHLEKDVVITAQNSGQQLLTDTLDWQKDKDLVSTEDHVTITGEQLTASGTGLVAHPELKTATMGKDITIEVQPQDAQPENDEPVVITCDGPMEIDQSKNMAILNVNVVALQKELGRELRADRMEVYFDPVTNQIKRLVCLGNVSIIQGGNKTYSEQAVYDAGEKKLTLLGRPKLVLMTGGENGLGAMSELGKKDETAEQPAAEGP